MEKKLSRQERRELLSKLLKSYLPDGSVPNHEHQWYKAGELIHPRMGWPVSLYLCEGNHWSNKAPCTTVSFDDSEEKYNVYETFEKGYWYLQAP